ncbi:MAG: hypothetical protein MZV63_05215 [Marinilabiliales bacterium]|nr:hypothetical protein [Marinilabiliales bacterium]
MVSSPVPAGITMLQISDLPSSPRAYISSIKLPARSWLSAGSLASSEATPSSTVPDILRPQCGGEQQSCKQG